MAESIRAGGRALASGAGSSMSDGGQRFGRDDAALIFTGEMYGVQLDVLADVLGATQRRAAAVVARWRQAGAVEAAALGPGPRWVWLTKAGLDRCGLPYSATKPGLARLEHLRAVSVARLALSSAAEYATGGGYWRSERRLRARMGGRIGLREHVPDAEVHWPDGTAVAWAGECWAIEAELTRKTVARTVTIMRELLTRTGDYGCLAADIRASGRPARHARVIYLCSPAAKPVVLRARDALGHMACRVEVRMLPDHAALGASR